MKTLGIEILGLPHCPRNRSHAIFKKGKASFLGKTEAARSYEKALLHHLEGYSRIAMDFQRWFDKQTQHLHATWEFYSPEVCTSSGKYSETGVDLDAHKVLQDTIMNFIGINDAYIVSDTRTKYQGDYKVVLVLRIKCNNGDDLL